MEKKIESQAAGNPFVHHLSLKGPSYIVHKSSLRMVQNGIQESAILKLGKRLLKK